MMLDEFFAKLNQKHPWYDDLTGMITKQVNEGTCRLAIKDESLEIAVQRLQEDGPTPLVDSRFKTVFWLERSHHGMFRTDLYRYFFYGRHPLSEYINPNDAMDRYVSEGCGWFISTMQPHVIIAGERYRPDEIDDKIFPSFKLETYQPTSQELLSRFRNR